MAMTGERAIRELFCSSRNLDSLTAIACGNLIRSLPSLARPPLAPKSGWKQTYFDSHRLAPLLEPQVLKLLQGLRHPLQLPPISRNRRLVRRLNPMAERIGDLLVQGVCRSLIGMLRVSKDGRHVRSKLARPLIQHAAVPDSRRGAALAVNDLGR